MSLMEQLKKSRLFEEGERVLDQKDNQDLEPEKLEEPNRNSENLFEQGMNELFEELKLTKAEVVDEEHGRGIKITINGKEYRYVPDRGTSFEFVVKGYNDLLNKKLPGRALQHLLHHALLYKGGREDKTGEKAQEQLVEKELDK